MFWLLYLQEMLQELRRQLATKEAEVATTTAQIRSLLALSAPPLTTHTQSQDRASRGQRSPEPVTVEQSHSPLSAKPTSPYHQLLDAHFGADDSVRDRLAALRCQHAVELHFDRGVVDCENYGVEAAGGAGRLGVDGAFPFLPLSSPSCRSSPPHSASRAGDEAEGSSASPLRLFNAVGAYGLPLSQRFPWLPTDGTDAVPTALRRQVALWRAEDAAFGRFVCSVSPLVGDDVTGSEDVHPVLRQVLLLWCEVEASYQHRHDFLSALRPSLLPPLGDSTLSDAPPSTLDKPAALQRLQDERDRLQRLSLLVNPLMNRVREREALRCRIIARCDASTPAVSRSFAVVTKGLRAAIPAWEVEYGLPFLYRGISYLDEIACETAGEKWRQDLALEKRVKRVFSSTKK